MAETCGSWGGKRRARACTLSMSHTNVLLKSTIFSLCNRCTCQLSLLLREWSYGGGYGCAGDAPLPLESRFYAGTRREFGRKIVRRRSQAYFFPSQQNSSDACFSLNRNRTCAAKWVNARPCRCVSNVLKYCSYVTDTTRSQGLVLEQFPLSNLYVARCAWHCMPSAGGHL